MENMITLAQAAKLANRTKPGIKSWYQSVKNDPDFADAFTTEPYNKSQRRILVAESVIRKHFLHERQQDAKPSEPTGSNGAGESSHVICVLERQLDDKQKIIDNQLALLNKNAEVQQAQSRAMMMLGMNRKQLSLLQQGIPPEKIPNFIPPKTSAARIRSFRDWLRENPNVAASVILIATFTAFFTLIYHLRATSEMQMWHFSTRSESCFTAFFDSDPNKTTTV